MMMDKGCLGDIQMIKERISYVIPIAIDGSKSGAPVLIYEMAKDSYEVDLSFGIFLSVLERPRNTPLASRCSMTMRHQFQLIQRNFPTICFSPLQKLVMEKLLCRHP